MLKPAAKENTEPTVETPEDDDITLMKRVAIGDQEAFQQLISRHGRRALGFMQRILMQRQDAEDEVQKAFLKVWQTAPSWRPEAKFTTWFYRVLMNQATDALRARRRFGILDDNIADTSMPTAEENLIASDRARVVQNALASLPERQRRAIILCHYEELSQNEAAELLGVSVGALESLLTRGRASLKAQIAKTWYH